MFKWAFLFLAGDADPIRDRREIKTEVTELTIVGCKNYAQAEEIAKEMADAGCTAIELCAGFGVEGVARMKRATGGKVAVGAVRFDYHPAFSFQSGDDLDA
ncbi:MAG: hypothetical protein J6P31_04615 [Oscillospiraceae bacterium]|nr:hypothetical protein [Oscillospiraceae bacterium]